MLEIIHYQFFQNALILSLLTAIVSAIIGTYIVVKKMSLISGSIAHGAFGGLGIAYYLGVNPLYGAVIFSIICASIISYFKNKAKNSLDSLLNVIWAFGMSIGLIFMFLTPGYSSDLMTYLFGNILLTSRSDLIFLFLLSLVVIIFAYLFYNSFLLILFDEDYARVRNLPVNLLNFILFSLIAISIIMIIKVVGIVLMIAILTIPSSTAILFKKDIKDIMFLSFLITIFSIITGLFISYYLDFATGPIIIFLVSLVYLTSLLFHQNKNKKQSMILKTTD